MFILNYVDIFSTIGSTTTLIVYNINSVYMYLYIGVKL